MGSEIDEIKLKAKKNFKKLAIFLSSNSKHESSKTYILCSGLSTQYTIVYEDNKIFFTKNSIIFLRGKLIYYR